jgi:hypothetical protein
LLYVAKDAINDGPWDSLSQPALINSLKSLIFYLIGMIGAIEKNGKRTF